MQLHAVGSINRLSLAPASTIPRPGVLSSTGITRPHRYYDPIRHPKGPVPRLTTPPLASTARQPSQGASRVAHNPHFAHAVATTPAEPLGACVVRFPNGGGLPRNSGRSASALPFSRPAQRSLHVTACALAESLTDPFTPECFSRFVTSTTVPIATGWNDPCRVGFAPTEVVHLCTAH